MSGLMPRSRAYAVADSTTWRNAAAPSRASFTSRATPPASLLWRMEGETTFIATGARERSMAAPTSSAVSQKDAGATSTPDSTASERASTSFSATRLSSLALAIVTGSSPRGAGGLGRTRIAAPLRKTPRS